MAIDPKFDFLGTEYCALLKKSDATAFQHPIWLDTLYTTLAPARGGEPLAVVGRKRNDGGLAFVLPLIRRRKSGVVLVEAANLGVSDYCSPVVDRDWQPGALPRNAIAALLAPFDILRICPVREEALVHWRMFFHATETALDFSAHAARLGPSYAEWRRSALQGSFAKYLDRKKKRFFTGGRAALELLTKPDEINTAIAAIQSLRQGRFAGDMIATDFVREFYARVAAAGASEGLARTYRLSLDGASVGYVFGLTWNGRFHYLLIGCDYAAHGRHSPGLILYDMIIEDWIRDGGEVFDFTIGDEAFKRDFATLPTTMHMLSQTPTWRGKLANAAMEARSQLRRLGAREI